MYSAIKNIQSIDVGSRCKPKAEKMRGELPVVDLTGIVEFIGGIGGRDRNRGVDPLFAGNSGPTPDLCNYPTEVCNNRWGSPESGLP